MRIEAAMPGRRRRPELEALRRRDDGAFEAAGAQHAVEPAIEAGAVAQRHPRAAQRLRLGGPRLEAMRVGADARHGLHLQRPARHLAQQIGQDGEGGDAQGRPLGRRRLRQGRTRREQDGEGTSRDHVIL
jgi:hypothetical protein